jgi:hypothetical protein
MLALGLCLEADAHDAELAVARAVKQAPLRRERAATEVQVTAVRTLKAEAQGARKLPERLEVTRVEAEQASEQARVRERVAPERVRQRQYWRRICLRSGSGPQRCSSKVSSILRPCTPNKPSSTRDRAQRERSGRRG